MNNKDQNTIERIAKLCYEKEWSMYHKEPINVTWENMTEEGRQFWREIVMLVINELSA